MTKKALSIRIDKDVYEKVEQLAKKDDRSMSSMIERLLKKVLGIKEKSE